MALGCPISLLDIVDELKSYGATVVVHDPTADPAEAKREYGIDLVPME